MRPLRICFIASSRFSIREPFAGGLEAHTYAVVRRLVARGHRVSLFAAPGSDPGLGVAELPVAEFRASATARADTAAPPEWWMAEHHAYLGLMLDLAGEDGRRFDVVHNNSLHHLPIAMSPALSIPMVTTLHTPPIPWLESALEHAPGACTLVAVSRYIARAWAHAGPPHVTPTVVPNGVDTEAWSPGPGGGAVVWSGRLVPEKGPHLAIDAARLAGRRLVLAGPIHDRAYFAEQIEPRLGPDVRYLGHLPHRELRQVVGRASVAVVSPVWDEPYGLVAAEALACGTPVAAFARGALPEMITESVGALAEPDDVLGLARAIDDAASRDRVEVRRHAERCCSERSMIEGYERVYQRLLTGPVAA